VLSSSRQARAARGEFEDAVFDSCVPFTCSASFYLDSLLAIEERGE
jgi:hypothetical protein